MPKNHGHTWLSWIVAYLAPRIFDRVLSRRHKKLDFGRELFTMISYGTNSQYDNRTSLDTSPPSY